MGDSEERSKDDTDATHYDVSNTHKRVLTAHNSSCRDQDRLGATVFSNGEIYSAIS